MIADIQKDAEQRMAKAVAAYAQSLKKLRTGRASTALLEGIQVDYYGSKVPLNQTANLVSVIEKAIMASDLGLTPVTAGTVIRVPLPPLTEERRRDLAKHINKDAEQARVVVRGIRREAMADVKELLKERDITEDDERKAEQAIQELTDRFVAQIDQVSADKQKEIMQV